MIKSPTICILGLGYVGLPLAVEFSKKYNVVGFDIDKKRVDALLKGIDVTSQVETNELENTISNGLKFSTEAAVLKECNIFIVTVPTPIHNDHTPDLRPLINASTLIGTYLKKGDYVIYESTTYPGCTEEDCVPVLEKESGLKYNKDFFVGYSPERINPGDKINTLTKIKKVTSGSTPEAANFIDELYNSIITAGTHKAPSIRIAEASKAIENAQRDINISFVNELALIFDKMGIDTQEVLEAAATKWNFLKFTPGLVGGHCISVDPYYLAYKSTQLGYTPKVISSGREVNDYMPYFVAEKMMRLMAEKGIPVQGSSILILGTTFKENNPDTRNSKIPSIAEILTAKGSKVDIYDPLIEEYKIEPPKEKFDAILLAVPHTLFRELNLVAYLKDKSKKIIFDLKSALPKGITDARL